MGFFQSGLFFVSCVSYLSFFPCVTSYKFAIISFFRLFGILIRSGQMVWGLLVFCIFVVRPRTLLHHSVRRVLKIWNLVVPIQSSKKATAFSSSQYSFSVSSEGLSMLVRVCLVTSMSFKGIGHVSSAEQLHDEDR